MQFFYSCLLYYYEMKHYHDLYNIIECIIQCKKLKFMKTIYRQTLGSMSCLFCAKKVLKEHIFGLSMTLSFAIDKVAFTK